MKKNSSIDSLIPILSTLEPTVPAIHMPPVLSSAPLPNVYINAIVQAFVQVTLAANAASVAANPPALYPTLNLPHPTGGHHPSASNNFFLKSWN